jgi:hypothetical protein
MNHPENDDNIYEAGTVVAAKEYPDRKLVIMKYLHRIYYCAVLGDANNHLAYFETQLMPPYADQ